MKWEMHENSVFAVLLRSPWWVSLAIALAIAAALRIFLPLEFAIFGGLPFVVIACVSGWRQLKRPGAKRIAATLERARGLSGDAFRAALEEGYRRQGYSAKRGAGAADLLITQRGIVTLVGCRRWKAARTGIEPLREFDAATSAQGAHKRLYVAVGEVSDAARAFAAKKGIKLVDGEELATLLPK
ncbi:MAG TPA: restriction endonuclease [Burkholderiales bacterium]|nr:restriction endonuclease [Burkholderiales bacterium]